MVTEFRAREDTGMFLSFLVDNLANIVGLEFRARIPRKPRKYRGTRIPGCRSPPKYRGTRIPGHQKPLANIVGLAFRGVESLANIVGLKFRVENLGNIVGLECECHAADREKSDLVLEGRQPVLRSDPSLCGK